LTVERDRDLAGVTLHMPARWTVGQRTLAVLLSCAIALMVTVGLYFRVFELATMALVPSGFLLLLLYDLAARRPATITLAVDRIHIYRPRLLGAPVISREIPLNSVRRSSPYMKRVGPNRPPVPCISLILSGGETITIGEGHPSETLSQVSGEINRALELYAQQAPAGRGSAEDVPASLRQLRARKPERS